MRHGNGRIVSLANGGNYIYPPKSVASDGCYPWSGGEEVEVRIIVPHEALLICNKNTQIKSDMLTLGDSHER